MSEFSKDELKKITKEAMKEWMEEKYSQFGRWTVRSLGTLGIAALLYFILKANGWVKIPFPVTGQH